jgi:aminoglycoside phosphotransferase (APT) family kinase protein
MPSELTQSSDLRIFDLLNRGTLVQKATSRHAEVVTFRVSTPQGSSLVAVKHLRLHGQRARDSLRNEFRTLQELQATLPEALSRTIPKPLLILEDEGTIFLTHVPGVPLDTMLRRDGNVVTSWVNFTGRKRLGTCGFRVGLWLKNFHDATAAAELKFDHEQFVGDLDSLMTKCASVGVSSSGLSAVRVGAMRLSSESSGRSVAVGALHGDLLPQNVLLDNGGPGVIDFASYAPSGPVYTDLAHFLGYLMILFAQAGLFTWDD